MAAVSINGLRHYTFYRNFNEKKKISTNIGMIAYDTAHFTHAVELHLLKTFLAASALLSDYQFSLNPFHAEATLP